MYLGSPTTTLSVFRVHMNWFNFVVEMLCRNCVIRHISIVSIGDIVGIIDNTMTRNVVNVMNIIITTIFTRAHIISWKVCCTCIFFRFSFFVWLFSWFWQFWFLIEQFRFQIFSNIVEECKLTIKINIFFEILRIYYHF